MPALSLSLSRFSRARGLTKRRCRLDKAEGRNPTFFPPFFPLSSDCAASRLIQPTSRNDGVPLGGVQRLIPFPSSRLKSPLPRSGRGCPKGGRGRRALRLFHAHQKGRFANRPLYYDTVFVKCFCPECPHEGTQGGVAGRRAAPWVSTRVVEFAPATHSLKQAWTVSLARNSGSPHLQGKALKERKNGTVLLRN